MAPPMSTPVPAPRRPILLVDDDAELVAMMARYLKHHGWRVETATDPRSVLDMVRAELPCLLVVDLMMPHMDGEELVLAIRGVLSDACPPVCLVSAAYSRKDVARKLELDATLDKPFELEDLRDVAVRFCSEHRDRMESMPPGRLS